MTESIFTIKENIALTDSVYKMTLEGDTSALSKPGQFVNIKLAGKFLRRPISVCEYQKNKLVLIYFSRRNLSRYYFTKYAIHFS